MKTLILGGGLAGLSISYFLGHHNCILVEKKSYLGGHAATSYRDGAFWDEGPHVSFTKHNLVKSLLTRSSSSDILCYEAQVGNFFKGDWIPHPAQSNLYAISEPLAYECYLDFLETHQDCSSFADPLNYQDFLDQSFGLTFSRTFPHAYTRKYWTCDPSILTTDWIGSRVFQPDINTVFEGYMGKPSQDTHYITTVRYPSHGGFGAFFSGIFHDANVIIGEVVSIDLVQKEIKLLDGLIYNFDKLVNTIPLSSFVSLLKDVPDEVISSSSLLRCTSLLLVNILGNQSVYNPYHWLYVYDEDKYSTRISQTHLLSPDNTPDDIAGIQVEVYSSPYKPFSESFDDIAAQVVHEVLDMSLLDKIYSVHHEFVPFANVIFDANRRTALDIIFTYLEKFGLVREKNDLDPITDWNDVLSFTSQPDLFLAGRYAQWNYYWSDDCVLRGAQLSGIHV